MPEIERPPVAVGRSFIVAIGIDSYRHWPGLECAVNDARAARDAFAALGFEDAAPPLYNEDATRDALLALVTDQLRALSEHDQLIVFYAGHGGTRTERPGGKETRTGYLVPVDAAQDDDNVATWIELGDWLHRVSLLPPRHILVILDSCHSGIALDPTHRWRAASRATNESLASLRAKASRRVITSALDNQLALDNGPSDGHSLFTGCLLETLQCLQVDRETLTASELGLRIQRRVMDYPTSQQTPDVGAFQHDERGELVVPADGGAIASPGGVAPLQIMPVRSPAIPNPPLPTPTWWRWRWTIAGVVFWILFLVGSAVLRT